MNTICKHVRIRGSVQMVGFRYHARKQAEAMGIRGWMRNRDNGTVEGVICGNDASVRRFLEWCARGPDAAQVGGMEVSEAEDPGHDGFLIRETV